MKPEHFCSGNVQARGPFSALASAPSMKPEHFCSGNKLGRLIQAFSRPFPSMKPEHFCSGNVIAMAGDTVQAYALQ